MARTLSKIVSGAVALLCLSQPSHGAADHGERDLTVGCAIAITVALAELEVHANLPRDSVASRQMILSRYSDVGCGRLPTGAYSVWFSDVDSRGMAAPLFTIDPKTFAITSKHFDF